MHRLDDVAAHAEVAQSAFGREPDHPLAGAGRGRQTHGFQMLEAANHEAADFRVRGTWLRRAEIDGARLISGDADFGVEPCPSFGADIALKGRADSCSGFGPSSIETSSSARARRPRLM